MKIKISATIIAALLATPALAQQSTLSNPQGSTGNASSTVQFISGYKTETGWKSAVKITLAQGWKTYWRVPGDAGVPAEFVWDGSENIAKITEHWPAPKRFFDSTGHSIGYKHSVIFPLTISTVDNDKPTVLKLKLFYAVCGEVCIPARAELQLQLNAGQSSQYDKETIEYAWTKIPSNSETRISIDKVEAVKADGHSVLKVSLKGQLSKDTDILVEGYDEAFFMPPKKLSDKQYNLEIDGLKNPSDLIGKTIRLTIISGEILLEKQVVVN